MKITTLTPVHIGSGQILAEDEYWSVRSSPSALWARVNLSALIGVCNDTTELARIGGLLETRDGLVSFLNEHDKNRIGDGALYRITVDHAIPAHLKWRCAEKQIRKQKQEEPLGPIEVHECLKSRFRGFLPGSSIKGALLTAVYLSQYATFEDASAALKGPRNPEQSGLSRRLRPSDTFGEADLSMHLCRRVMRDDEGDLRPLELWVECLSAGQVLSAELSRPVGTQSGLAKPLTRPGIERLCLAANKLTFAIWRKDEDHFTKYGVPRGALDDVKDAAAATTSPTSCLLRLGWGVGQAATSVQLLDPCWAASAFPKTRWLVANPVGFGEPSEWEGGRAIPLGWIRIDFEESDYV